MSKLESEVDKLEKSSILSRQSFIAKIRASLSFERNRLETELAEFRTKVRDLEAAKAKVRLKHALVEYAIEGRVIYVQMIQDVEIDTIEGKRFEEVFSSIYYKSTFYLEAKKPLIGHTVFKIENNIITVYETNHG